MSRLGVLKLCFLALAVAVAGRAVQLAAGRDPRLARLAERQFRSKITQLPRRGLIFDRNGQGLAISLKASSLFLRPEILRKEYSAPLRQRLLSELARTIHVPLPALKAKAASTKGFVWVKRQLTAKEDQAIRESQLLDYGDGIGLMVESQRFYPDRELAAHVLGAVNVDGHGIEGLELFYEAILNGERARVSSGKDAMGRRIFQDEQGLTAFKDGQSIVLTIDKGIQYEAEKALRTAIEEHQARAGTVLVAEVATGEILAMANSPTFDPNEPSRAGAESRRNRAVTDTYEPGSTFKPFVMAAAIEKGRSPRRKIYCERGSFVVGGHKISEAEARERFEWLDYPQILKYSSNIGAAKIALDLGPAAMGQFLDRLGVGKRTEIDLPGEVPGTMERKSLGMQVRLANVGFGQGITVTPLQMLTYYLAIANGGKWVQPKLVKAILAEDPDSLEQHAIRWKLGHRFDELKSRRVISPVTAAQLTEMLAGAVKEGGTGAAAQLDEWPVAGKTGTAQKIDPITRHYSRTRHIASFAGFAPVSEPKLVALVLLDEPQKKYFGAETAAPAFREVMRAALLKSGVPPVDSRVRLLELANRSTLQSLAQESSSPARAEGPSGSQPERNAKAQLRLPDLRGLTMREALRALGPHPVRVEVLGSGILKEQIPPSDQWLEAGSNIRLRFERAQ